MTALRKISHHDKVKTTLYMDIDNQKRLNSFVSEKKSSFINRILRDKLDEIEQAQQRDEAIAAIESCPTFKIDKKSEDVIRDIREERTKHLLHV